MPQLSIMIKPASSLCNLRCKYCFYHSLSQEREKASFGIMDSDTQENLVKKSLAFADGDSIYYAFQGGEPTLAGIEYFENFVTLVKKYNVKKSTIFYSLQTNGTLLTQQWADFFLENEFLIGLSLDGDQNGNRYRIDQNFDYAFNKAFEGAKLLQKTNVQFNILVVTTGWTATHIEEVYRFFTSQNMKYLQFIPCLRPFGDKSENEMFMTVEQYGDFLIRLFNLYVKDYVRGSYTSVRYLDNLVHLYLGNKIEQCGLCGYCSHQFVIEGNGNVYPCDFYCLDEWQLGNINTDSFEVMAHSQRAIQFIKESFDIPNKCKQCQLLGICRAGGCKRSRQDRDYCLAYKKFFSACLPMFRVFAQEKTN